MPSCVVCGQGYHHCSSCGWDSASEETCCSDKCLEEKIKMMPLSEYVDYATTKWGLPDETIFEETEEVILVTIPKIGVFKRG